MREHEGFLQRLEERLSRVSGWIGEGRRPGGEDDAARPQRGRLAALRREVAEARRAIRETSRADLARVRAGLEDLERDYDVPPPHTGLTRAELAAFKRHLRTTARLVRELSTADDPRWSEADTEYEQSWAELERARTAGEPASP